MALPSVPSRREAETITNALGWVTLGLAAVELAAPGALARSVGLKQNHQFLKGLGVREVGSRAGLFGWRRARPLVIWARVAGDALDLAALAPALRRSNPRRGVAVAAFAAVAGVTLLDVLCARALSKDRR
ncbi:hypothetical protein ACFQ4O_08860 [Methylopila musalis]|uniref:Cyclase dehydrase n=1 Tax=Methylopila musalis TaxID=1134781 RepID=A0ABW3Z763_9HYPH